jgi:hypothetical protein
MRFAMDLVIDPVIGLTARLLVALVFGSAALDKLRARGRFTGILRDYRILPTVLVAPAAAIVIALEAFVTLAIWWPPLRTAAAATGLLLLTAYALAIALNLVRGRREIDCGCSFGGTGEPLSWALPVRNAVLALVCVTAGLPPSGTLPWLGLVVALPAAAALALCYRTWGALLANRPQLLRLRAS